MVLFTMSSSVSPPPPEPVEDYRSSLLTPDRSVIVTNQAMGARCAVAADFDNDGRLDIVAASSNDNAVSWFHNEGPANVTTDDESDSSSSSLLPTFSIKKQITWSSLGSRIVTAADIDSDGDMDVVGASYYDSSLRWFENDGSGNFTPRLISSSVNEGQGVHVADVDNNGSLDIITASSGDNTIAVFRNVDGNGTFCEIKQVVDANAMGARTAIAADLNGDGWVDIASASKDDDTVAWYPNDGTGLFPTKLIVSQGNLSMGAYSLVARDVDGDGSLDLVVASNGNDSVTLWRNDGMGNFTRTLIYDQADFVLSVTAVDFDRDGDIDVASASFFDGKIIWHENLDGQGYSWTNHTIYVGLQGHYVSHGDIDGDGDEDLIAVTHADNTVIVFFARTGCDFDSYDDAVLAKATSQACCVVGTMWNASSMTCESCPSGQYGIETGAGAECTACPPDVCTIESNGSTPTICHAISGCVDVERNIAECSCPIDTVKDASTDLCTGCPEGQIRQENPDFPVRTLDTLGNYSVWEERQGFCVVLREESDANNAALIGVIVALVVVVMISIVGLVIYMKRGKKDGEDVWRVLPSELVFSDPPEILGRGTFGLVVLAEYRGTKVAVKRVIPTKSKAPITDSIVAAKGAKAFLRARMSSMESVPNHSSDIAQGSTVLPASCELPRSTLDVPDLMLLCENGIEKSVDSPHNKVAITDGANGSMEPSALRPGSSSLGFHRSLYSSDISHHSTSTPLAHTKCQSSLSSGGSGESTNGTSGLPDFAPAAGNGLKVLTRRGSNDERGHKTVVLKRGESNGGGFIYFWENINATENASKSCNEVIHSRLVKDFMMEMRHLSKLRHPCITTIMGAVIEPGAEPSLILEYMDRGSLYDLLHNDTVTLDGDLLLPILQDICQGLRFLHSANPSIIHGDLKSANILVDSKSRAKIADFGLTQKKKMGIVGTPFWMSPELLRGESGNTLASDVYSFGIILYEVYSRKDPYHDDADDIRIVLMQVCDPKINKRPPVPLACPDTIGVIMRECLDGDPSVRPTFEELDLRLRRERVENVEPGDMRLTVQIKSSDHLNRAESFIYEIFPRHIADALKEGRKVEPEHHECVSVFFSDIVNFTTISQELGHKKVAVLLGRLYNKFDALSEKHSVFKIEVIGDAYLAVTNLVEDQSEDHVKRIAEFSIDAVSAANEIFLDEDDMSRGCVQIRVGFHSGPVIADVLGTRLPKYSIFGDTVNTASRMESNSLPGRIHCSSTSSSLLRIQAPEIPQISRGHIEIKGKGEMHTFWVNEKEPDIENGLKEKELVSESVNAGKLMAQLPPP
eukprot:CCRYP_006905-RB/>CCRYP_006905-RB protein AED:0.04 eAED:0.04 QI:102/1/1/1/0.8/0.66/6/1055/1315